MPTHLSALDDALIDAAGRWGDVLGGGRPVRDDAEAAELAELYRALERLNHEYATAERLAGLATELRAGQIVGTSALLAVRARTALGREGPVPFDGALCDPQPGVLAGHGQFHWADPDAPWRGGRWLMAHRESERSAAVEIRSGRPADAAMIVQAAAALAVARAADAGQRVFRS